MTADPFVALARSPLHGAPVVLARGTLPVALLFVIAATLVSALVAVRMATESNVDELFLHETRDHAALHLAPRVERGARRRAPRRRPAALPADPGALRLRGGAHAHPVISRAPRARLRSRRRRAARAAGG